jgi:acyltransferase
MRDRTILGLKGIAIIGVVMHHISNRRLDPEAVEYISFMVQFFEWCVLGFLLVSGYLQAMSDSRKPKTLLEFLRARVMRLLVPFVVLTLLYSVLWQLLQATHIPNVGVRVPHDFLGKLETTLWPVNSQVAQQIYFFPLLFGISVVMVLFQKTLGLWGVAIAMFVAAGCGLAMYPNSYTGFSWGVFVWGIAFYGAGYLMFHYRSEKQALRLALFGVTFVFVMCNTDSGIIRTIPLWLLGEGSTLRLDRMPLLDRIGDASGTIYIYHSPFLILPLVIAVTHLHGAIPQFFGIIAAVMVAVAVCCLIFNSLKNTRAKVILM